MKKFIKKHWTWFLVALYVISPDFVPGPLDDMVLVFAEIMRKVLLYVVKVLFRNKHADTTHSK